MTPTDDSTPSGPGIESPVRVEIKAEATGTLEKLADAGIRFVDDTAGRVGRAASDLVVDVLDVLRGPLQRFRVRQLTALALETKKLQEAQGVLNPKALPPAVQQLLLDKATLNEDARIRQLWSQLIVNAQAGMKISAYLFELLSKLDVEDVNNLDQVAKLQSGKLFEIFDTSTQKLESLGLLECLHDVKVSVERTRGAIHSEYGDDDAPDPTAKAEMWPEGYVLSSLGRLLYDAATTRGPST